MFQVEIPEKEQQEAQPNIYKDGELREKISTLIFESDLELLFELIVCLLLLLLLLFVLIVPRNYIIIPLIFES